ncbi:MAG: NusG domain II-containing protein [Oscillospiraceae bacterium]|nr:NusG domain II-containing protein [Oscillospiraceae bacterium]
MSKNRKAILIIIGVFIISILALLALRIFGTGRTATVEYDGEVIMNVDLSEDAVYHIDARLPVTLIVENGRIFFTDSVCPDHLCEGFGRIHIKGQSAICLPARVAVYID